MRIGQLKFTSLLLVLSSCVSCGAQRELPADVMQLGKIDNPAITESSGVVASRKYTNVFWTHNDGGKSETLFAISREGKTLGQFKVAGANFDDWEDIAMDNDGHLYLADTGDNESKRKKVSIFKVAEPDPSSATPSVRVSQKWELRWPNGAVDSEALFIYQNTGYLVTKVKNDRRAEVYRFQLATADPQILEFVARLNIDSPVTGADISHNGAAVALVAGTGAFVYRVDGDISKLAQARPFHTRFKHDSMEACTFVADGLLTTAESKEIFLFTSDAFRVLR